jgi:hypothetical protein
MVLAAAAQVNFPIVTSLRRRRNSGDVTMPSTTSCNKRFDPSDKAGVAADCAASSACVSKLTS